jgi:transformation/transcription domain-associated protein
LQQYVSRAQLPPAQQAADDGLLTQATNSNIARFAESLGPAAVKVRFLPTFPPLLPLLTHFSSPTQVQFEKDFLSSKPTLREYVSRLQIWRDRYEAMLNKKAKRANLEASSHWLVEFQYQKFDEIEVPGQYLQHEDNNNNFVRISHFANKYDVNRGHGIYFRRLTILGQDGSVHQFAIQIPATRTSRREERIMQLFRMLNWFVLCSSSLSSLLTDLPSPPQHPLEPQGVSQAQPPLHHPRRRSSLSQRSDHRE